jgi:hypothetical protein
MDDATWTTRAASERRMPTAIVVGAGVSGCACAAALASAGMHVTLVNSAMDRVGLPAYGPDLVARGGGWEELEEVLARLPRPLRDVWEQAAWTPASGEAVLNIDRRRISIESKRLLELIPGLQFRQGFVTDLRLTRESPHIEVAGDHEEGDGGPIFPRQASAAVDAAGQPGARLGANPGSQPGSQLGAQAGAGAEPEVETIFGEVFQADVVVVAVGLSLGAHITTGTGSMPGGRYGEPASEGLLAALEALGAEFRQSELEVGPRVSASGARDRSWLSDLDDVRAETGEIGSGVCRPERQSRLVALTAPGHADSPEGSWPSCYPPAPHRQADLRADRMVLEEETVDCGHMGRSPLLSPDGAATSEMYVAPGGRYAKEIVEGLRTEEGGATPEGTGGRAPGECVPGEEPHLASPQHETCRPTPHRRPMITSRMPLVIRGATVAGLSATGRLSSHGAPTPVWIVGRAAGAPDYVSSLASGLRAAGDIAGFLGWPGDDRQERESGRLKEDRETRREGETTAIDKGCGH